MLLIATALSIVTFVLESQRYLTMPQESLSQKIGLFAGDFRFYFTLVKSPGKAPAPTRIIEAQNIKTRKIYS